MSRENSEGLLRRDLAWALTQVRLVRDAVKFDACLLCRGGRVQACGLCENCLSQLTLDESALAERWSSGHPPEVQDRAGA